MINYFSYKFHFFFLLLQLKYHFDKNSVKLYNVGPVSLLYSFL